MADDPIIPNEEEIVPSPEVEIPEPQDPEALEPEEVEEPEVPEEEPEEEEKPPSRREQLRIKDVLERRAQAQRPSPSPKASGIDYREALDADPEVIKQLEDDRNSAVAAAMEQNRAELNTVRWENMLNIDAPQVESKYPILDKNSPDFHPALADAINQMYLSATGFDPDNGTVSNANLRYRDYVESIFELGDEIGATRTADTRKNITKQASQTGLRPDGSQGKRLNLNKAPEAMTDAELDAIIAQAIPSKK